MRLGPAFFRDGANPRAGLRPRRVNKQPPRARNALRHDNGRFDFRIMKMPDHDIDA